MKKKIIGQLYRSRRLDTHCLYLSQCSGSLPSLSPLLCSFVSSGRSVPSLARSNEPPLLVKKTQKPSVMTASVHSITLLYKQWPRRALNRTFCRDCAGAGNHSPFCVLVKELVVLIDDMESDLDRNTGNLSMVCRCDFIPEDGVKERMVIK